MLYRGVRNNDVKCSTLMTCRGAKWHALQSWLGACSGNQVYPHVLLCFFLYHLPTIIRVRALYHTTLMTNPDLTQQVYAASAKSTRILTIKPWLTFRIAECNAMHWPAEIVRELRDAIPWPKWFLIEVSANVIWSHIYPLQHSHVGNWYEELWPWPTQNRSR